MTAGGWHQSISPYTAVLQCTVTLILVLLQHAEAERLRLRQLELFAYLRPLAVSLVDAFDLPDEALRSTLGSYDGQVRQAESDVLLRNNPINMLISTENVSFYSLQSMFH